MDAPTVVLSASDVKQWHYCPRVVYYHYFLPVRRATAKMAEGKLAQGETEEREARRTLHAYGLQEGRRHFDVALRSPRLGLAGRLDLLLEMPHEVIPVDFKNTEGGVGLNHRYQLAAYALLVEDVWRRPVRRGFVYLIPEKRAVEVVVTSSLRRRVHADLERIRAMLAAEALPAPTRVRARCTDCEFRAHCNDIG